MSFLSDTNVSLRWAHPLHPDHLLARKAIETLLLSGEKVYVTPQNLIEFWNVATRPANHNGFGLTPAQADQEVALLESHFPVAPDTPAIYPEWRQLVVTVGVSGV